jgi:hypothetical protein
VLRQAGRLAQPLFPEKIILQKTVAADYLTGVPIAAAFAH